MSVPENLLSHARSVLEGVKQSWLCGQYADTSLCGEQGAQARCHRLILTSVSRLLHSVLRDLVSDGEDDICIILPGLQQDDMEVLLQFLYTGAADLTSEHQHVVQLLQALEVPLTFDAEMLKMSIKQPGEQPKLKMLLPQSCPMETTVEESEIFHVEKVHQLGSLHSDITNTVNIDDSVTVFSFSCSLCDLNFSSEQILANHMVSEHQYKPELENTELIEFKFKCDFCDQYFQSRTHLDTHIRSDHEAFICDLCNKVLSSSDALTQHKSTHRAAKNFKCAKCDELFRWRAEYRRHAETVHGQKITDMTTCNICNKQIVSKRLNEHIKSVHGNEKPFQCKQCIKRFAKPSELRNHLRTHTGERPFECDICNASFAYSHILTRHKKYHDGTKRFTCSVCSKSFLQKNDLVKHSRIHSGEKPYKCDLCGKDFARMDYLKKHQMLHSTETKFCCGECGELCGSVDGLKKHRKHSHNKEKPNIEFNSFEDLALQLPNIASIGNDNVLESISELQAVSLDGGKTIMILNESEHSVYTEVHLQDDMESMDTGADHILSSESAVDGGSVILQADQTHFGTFVEPTEVLYAVEY